MTNGPVRMKKNFHRYGENAPFEMNIDFSVLCHKNEICVVVPNIIISNVRMKFEDILEKTH